MAVPHAAYATAGEGYAERPPDASEEKRHQRPKELHELRSRRHQSKATTEERHEEPDRFFRQQPIIQDRRRGARRGCEGGGGVLTRPWPIREQHLTQTRTQAGAVPDNQGIRRMA
jgi:hypothetical protein